MIFFILSHDQFSVTIISLCAPYELISEAILDNCFGASLIFDYSHKLKFI